MVTCIELSVPTGYVLPTYLQRAAPEEVANLLNLAAYLPAVLAAEAGRQDVHRTVREALQEHHALGVADAVARAEERLAEAQGAAVNAVVERGEELAAALRRCERAEYEREALQRTLDERVAAARTEEALRAKQEMQAAVDDARRELHATHAAKMQLEETRYRAMEEHGAIVERLQGRVKELETPMGRGIAGEVDVAQSFRDMGFLVEDTSMGEKRNAGFLDLLVQPPEAAAADAPLRIAIEVKNCKDIKPEHLCAFDEHVRSGLAAGLFDSAIFVSIRGHVRKRGHDKIALELYDDASGVPLVPVSWIGPERGRDAAPLAQEQLEAHALLHTAFVARAHALRSVLAKEAASASDADKGTVVALVDGLAAQFNATFVDLGKQEACLDEMRRHLTNVRVRQIEMLLSLCQANREVPWLGRGVGTPWLAVLETARAKAATTDDGKIWNDCNHKKDAITRGVGAVGKEAFMRAVRLPSGKRSRDD